MNEILIEYLDNFIIELQSNNLTIKDKFEFVTKLFLYHYSEFLGELIQKKIDDNQVITIPNLQFHAGLIPIRTSLDGFRNLIQESTGINIYEDQDILNVVNCQLEKFKEQFEKEQWDEIINV